MTIENLTALVAGIADLDLTRHRVKQLDADAVIGWHNRLKELDDMLRDRWYELDCPHPELLK